MNSVLQCGKPKARAGTKAPQPAGDQLRPGFPRVNPQSEVTKRLRGSSKLTPEQLANLRDGRKRLEKQRQESPESTQTVDEGVLRQP